jgi:hypothetical protein
MRHSKGVSFTLGAFRYGVLYLIDAGQVLRALVLPELGWNDSVVTFVERMDVIQLLFQMVTSSLMLSSARNMIERAGELGRCSSTRLVFGFSNRRRRRFVHAVPAHACFQGTDFCFSIAGRCFLAHSGLVAKLVGDRK